jgi:23S rRNA (cytosine1962-C5)-methyltransferase
LVFDHHIAFRDWVCFQRIHSHKYLKNFCVQIGNNFMNIITLKKNAERRIKGGHLWIFSNEIQDPPVKNIDPGAICEIRGHNNEFIGMGYANPAGLIAARLLTRKKTWIDKEFLRQRIGLAHEHRRFFYPDREHYRLVFGESDLLPGLVIDKYAGVFVLQSLTAGMDRLQSDVVEIIAEMFDPECVYARNDSPMRALEGLPLEKKPVYGQLPDRLIVESHGIKMIVDPAGGQKTGHYLDQEDNRSMIGRYVRNGSRALDLFCYTGGWALLAAKAGATVTGVDSSAAAIESAGLNGDMNGLGDRCDWIRGPALEYLKRSAEMWDLIVLDPPAFIKSRTQIKEGRKGYIDFNRRALTRLNSGGILITCSCSHHMDEAGFQEILLAASRQSGKYLRVLEVRSQPPDHPFLVAMPETRYLTVVAAQVI